MNTITQEQSELKQLERLAAQRQLYSDAKRIQLFYIVINIFAVIIWSFLVLIFPKLRIWWAIWGLLATVLGITVFVSRQKELQEQAAIIQQMFDCDVLQMDWGRLNTRKRVDPELISKKRKVYEQKHPKLSNLQNWYPISVSQLPLHYARLICQRSNFWWDAQLRGRYVKWVLNLMIFLSIVLLLIGLINNLTLRDFLLKLVVPLSPIYYFGINQFIEQKEAVSSWRGDNPAKLCTVCVS